MPSESESQQISRRILELATTLGMLTKESFDSIVGFEDGDLCDPCDNAIARELISIAEVDTLRPLAMSDSYLPGYHIDELVGQGTSGVVYRAKQMTLGRTVALKLLKSGLLDNTSVVARSQLEARIGASLQHPGIVTVFDHGVHNQRMFLAMEFLEGESLECLIDSSGRIDHAEALRMARQVSAALRYANTQGVVHRDIKPANLMLVEDKAGLSDLANNKAVKITDFGLAFNQHQTDATRLTVAGATLGTPCYVAPEQLESTDVDQRADIYALGATLFHMVTGEQPFAGENAFKALASKMHGSEQWLDAMDDSVPAPLRQLIVDMTRSDQAVRIQDYETVENRINNLLSSGVQSSQVSANASPTNVRRTSSPSPTKPNTPITHASASLKSSSSLSLKRMVNTAIVAITFLVLAGLAAFKFAPGNPETSINQKKTAATVPDRKEVVPARQLTPYRLLDVFEGLPQQRRTGFWRIGKDGETTDVMVGENGWKQFPIEREHQQTGFYRFRVEIDTSPEQDSVDVCFGFESDGQCHIARVTKEQVVIGRGRVSDEKTFGTVVNEAELQFAPTPDCSPISLATRRSYIRIERQPGAWFINVNDKQLSSVRAKANDDPAIYLRANSGTAWFSDIWVTVLEPTQPAKDVSGNPI